MNRYIKFDVEQFLRDSTGWKKQLEGLNAELESITEIGGSGGGVPSGGNISNPTQNTVLRRQDIEAKITRITDYQEAFEYAWDRISEYDKDMITGFFFASGPIYDFVNVWCQEKASNAQYCYRDRNAALNHFRTRIERWMRNKGYDV